MATTTPLLSLTKPDGSDPAAISVLNANADILDNAVTLLATQTLTNKTLTSPHMTTPTVDSGGLTVSTGGVTITAGGLTVTAGGATISAGDLAVSSGALSIGSTPASAGTIRLPNNNIISWRNAGNSANANLYINSSDQLQLDVSGTTNLRVGAATFGVFGATPQNKQTVTGSRGANAALASLLTILASYGLITDSSS